jgi:hypothetical protein
MNKTARIIVIVVALIVLGGGAAYLFGASHKASTQSEQSTTGQNQSQQMPPQKKSLFDFFSMSGSQKCTFSDKTTSGSGTVYVSSGKMRGDFQSTDNGKTNASHMINDGTFVYVWSDGQKQGYKMSLESVKKEASQVSMAPGNNSSDKTPSQAVNMKQQSDYSCGSWSADASVFAMPSGVTFTDFSAMMQGAPTGAVMHPSSAMQGNKAACSQCNQVPAGAARNQCLAALKC